MLPLIHACGGGDESGIQWFTSSSKIEQISVSGVGESSVVNSQRKVSLTIDGINNTVSIQSNITELTVSGTNNLLNFADGVEINSCSISGSDNLAKREGALIMSCQVTGAGNTGFKKY